MAKRTEYYAPKAFAVEIQKRNKKEKRPQVKHYVAGVLTPRDLDKLGKDRVAKLVEDGRVVARTIDDDEDTTGSRKKAASEAKSGKSAATS